MANTTTAKSTGSIKNSSAGKYVSRYADKISAALEQVMNRENKAYNPSGDATYNYYKKSYEEAAKKASENAAGLASELSGGYLNSYGMTAANSAYSNEMKKLDDLVPTLEKQYYERQKREEDSAYERLNALLKLDSTDYSRYSDNEDRLLSRDKAERAAYENDRDYDRKVLESDRSYNRSVLESDRKNELSKAELALKELTAKQQAEQKALASSASKDSTKSEKYPPNADGSFSAISGYDFLDKYEDRMRTPEECLYSMVQLFGKQDGFYGWLAHVPIPNDPERKTYGDLLSELKGSSPYDFTPAMLNLSDSSRADYMKNAQMGATPPHSLKVN